MTDLRIEPHTQAAITHFFTSDFSNLKVDGEDIKGEKAVKEAIHLYTKSNKCCDELKRIFQVIWEAIKFIFCSETKWQKGVKALSTRLIKKGHAFFSGQEKMMEQFTWRLKSTAGNSMHLLLKANREKQDDSLEKELEALGDPIKKAMAAKLREITRK